MYGDDDVTATVVAPEGHGIGGEDLPVSVL